MKYLSFHEYIHFGYKITSSMCSLRMLVIDLRDKHVVSCQVTIRFQFKRLNQPHHSADTKLTAMPAVDDRIK